LSLSAAWAALLYELGGGDDDEEATTVFNEGGSKLQLFQDESLEEPVVPAGYVSEEYI
jgi:hypothetical protein